MEEEREEVVVEVEREDEVAGAERPGERRRARVR